MPVIDLFAPYSFAKAHVFLTTMMIVALVALSWYLGAKCILGKLRPWVFVVYLGGVVLLLGAAFKTEPSPLSQLMDPAYQAQLLEALQKAQQSAPGKKEDLSR